MHPLRTLSTAFVQLRHPNAPCLMHKKGKHVEYFPLELCEISKYQRVHQKKMDGKIQAEVPFVGRGMQALILYVNCRICARTRSGRA